MFPFSRYNAQNPSTNTLLKEKEVSSFSTHCSKFRCEKCSWHVSVENGLGRRRNQQQQQQSILFGCKCFAPYKWIFSSKHFEIVLIFNCNLSVYRTSNSIAENSAWNNILIPIKCLLKDIRYTDVIKTLLLCGVRKADG